MAAAMQERAASLLKPLQQYTAERLAAVERRRAARRARSAIRKGDGCLLEDLAIYETTTVDRCVRRFVPIELQHHAIYRLFAYWQLRRLGYDAWNKYLRDSGHNDAKGARILHPPDQTRTWHWWMGLHWKSRYAAAGRNPLNKRDEMQGGWILSNPAFTFVVNSPSH